MDITLERILSLIPRKPNGQFKHGAQSEFARSLGFKDGHIISDWIAGNASSYNNYVYAIAAKYDVSVEWLRGETDEKKPTTEEGDGLEGLDAEERMVILRMRKSSLKKKQILDMSRIIDMELDDEKK